MNNALLPERIRLPHSIQKTQTAHLYYHRVTKAEIAELCIRIEERKFAPEMRGRPPQLGLRNALTAAFTYMHRNGVQAEIAEAHGVSQPTLSRAISAITPLLTNALLDFIPVVTLRFYTTA